MAYFSSYFSSYFDIAQPAAATRRGGGLAPSQEEWERYLRRWHELRRQEAAEKAADRDGLRQLLREREFPKPPPKKQERPQPKEQQTATRIIALPHKVNPEIDIRIRIAELLWDLRHRTQAEKRKRNKKRKRDEDAIIALLYH